MKMPVSEFKAKCTQVLRSLAGTGVSIEVTSRGKVVAVVTVPQPGPQVEVGRFAGCLQGTVTYCPGWDEPLGDDDWEAAR